MWRDSRVCGSPLFTASYFPCGSSPPRSLPLNPSLPPSLSTWTGKAQTDEDWDSEAEPEFLKDAVSLSSTYDPDVSYEEGREGGVSRMRGVVFFR